MAELHPSSACFIKKLIEAKASVDRSFVKELARKFSKLATYAENDLPNDLTGFSKNNRILMQWVLPKKQMG